MPPPEYAIEGGWEGKRRLELVGRIFDRHTARFLDTIGVPPGISALDVGCGGGNVTLEVARRVGPAGRVVGIDFDGEILEYARRDADAAGLANVEFRPGDVRSAGAGPYDLVTARFVLSHLADPESVVAGLVAVLRPGGRLAVEDTDFTTLGAVPASPVLIRTAEIYRETLRRGGGDADIGLRLSELLREAGLEDVAAEPVQPTPVGDDRELMVHTLRLMEGRIVERGVLAAGELGGFLAELSPVVDEPDLVVAPAVVQAVGRIP
jgi:2-polyprenyl-3-methyl-5-hydroxy-6-metoxy-1,4-benzoquinol methylase